MPTFNAPSIQAVLFDYGQVLSAPPDPAAWSDMCGITGLPEEALHAAYWEPRHAYDAGHLSGREYWARVTSTCTPALPQTRVDHLLAADIRLWTQLNDPMIAWARFLQRRGMKTGILSNIGDEMAAGINTKFPWIADFHHCTWSHTLNTAKPDPAIYLHAASGLDTAPGNILFIEDREDNIVAAREVGMVAIQYQDHQSFVDEMKALALDHLLQPPNSPL